MEVYHINYVGPGYLRVSVQVPNNDTTLLWQTHAVQKLVLNYSNDPEILTFTQTGGTAGSINLTCVMKPTGQPSYSLGVIISYNASISELINALNYFSFFSTYQLSGVRNMYDANGIETNDSTAAVKYVWTVSVYYLRPTTATKMVITPKFIGYSGTQSFTIVTTHAHGPVIVGSFGLQIGQYTIMYAGTSYIPYNINPFALQSSIRAIAGF